MPEAIFLEISLRSRLNAYGPWCSHLWPVMFLPSTVRPGRTCGRTYRLTMIGVRSFWPLSRDSYSQIHIRFQVQLYARSARVGGFKHIQTSVFRLFLSAV